MVDDLTWDDADALPRRPMDTAAYGRRSREGSCFVCETLAGNPDYPGHVVWTEAESVAFLARYNTLLGHTLVAPRAHREQVTGDFGMQEYLDLQRLVYQSVRRSAGSFPPSGSSS
jgi:diadenosine tetraphosphate (Ap4A) HIT family hydrolase